MLFEAFRRIIRSIMKSMGATELFGGVMTNVLQKPKRLLPLREASPFTVLHSGVNDGRNCLQFFSTQQLRQWYKKPPATEETGHLQLR